MIIIVILVLIISIVVILFSFPQLSPIPYFPSNKKDAKIIINSLHVTNNQVILDLGAGDGWVIFDAAHESFKKNLNTQFVALEINPILFAILHLRRLLHPNKKNVHIILGDMFKLDYAQLIKKLKIKPRTITFYFYISPWLLQKALDQINKSITHYCVISYFYALPSQQPTKVSDGIHKLYEYDSEPS